MHQRTLPPVVAVLYYWPPAVQALRVGQYHFTLAALMVLAVVLFVLVSALALAWKVEVFICVRVLPVTVVALVVRCR